MLTVSDKTEGDMTKKDLRRWYKSGSWFHRRSIIDIRNTNSALHTKHVCHILRKGDLCQSGKHMRFLTYFVVSAMHV